MGLHAKASAMPDHPVVAALHLVLNLRNGDSLMHMNAFERMLGIEIFPGLLAFGIPGFAPDERLPSTQLHYRSNHEPHQEI